MLFTLTAHRLTDALSVIPTLFLTGDATPDNLFVEVWATPYAERLVFSAHNTRVALSVSVQLDTISGNTHPARAVLSAVTVAHAAPVLNGWAKQAPDAAVTAAIHGDVVSLSVRGLSGQGEPVNVILLGECEHFPHLGAGLLECDKTSGEPDVTVHKGVPSNGRALEAMPPDTRRGSALAAPACATAKLWDVQLWGRVDDPGCSHGWFTASNTDGSVSVYGAV